MAEEQGIDLLFQMSEPECYSQEPTYLDVDSIRSLAIYEKLPALETFLQLCLSDYPHLNYQLFNYNIKQLKLKHPHSIVSTLTNLVKGEDAELHYNAITHTLRLESLDNHNGIMIMLVNILGTKCYKADRLAYYKQGIAYQIATDMPMTKEIIACVDHHLEGGPDLNELLSFYLCNRYFNIPDCLSENLRVIMCQIERLMGEDLLERYAVADSVGLLNDFSLCFDDEEWVKFKTISAYLFELLRIKTVDNETELIKLQGAFAKVFEDLWELLDNVIQKQRQGKKRVLC